MGVVEELKNRYTCRQYKKDAVIPKEHLEAMARAALDAPNALNKQEFDIVVVTNRDLLLRACNKKLQQFPEGARQSFIDRIDAMKVENPITGDAPAVLFFVKNGREINEFNYVNIGASAMAANCVALEYGYQAMCLGCLMWGDSSNMEAELGLEKGSLLFALAVGQPRDDAIRRPRERFNKFRFVE